MSISKILGATMAAEARMQRQHGPHTLRADVDAVR